MKKISAIISFALIDVESKTFFESKQAENTIKKMV